LVIAASREPLGARELTRRIDGEGRRLSESTVNRLLRRLDEQGLTRSLDGHGRVASDAGALMAARAHAEQTWHAEMGSLELRTLQDARDLLIVRRGVEREIARAVAGSITPDGIEALRTVLREYELAINAEKTRRDASINFHKALASLVDNTMLHAVALVIFDPRFDTLEQVLDVVTASRGTTHDSPREHEELMAAIAAGDPDAAEAAMVSHIDRLIRDASAAVQPSTRLAIELLLQNQPPTTSRLGLPELHPGERFDSYSY
jgi:GntR family L-lactate dehydrogenase operon transcriptional regulator